jgi:hypothetical protein
MTRLIRIDPSKNMHRWYAITLEPTLFGEIAVVRPGTAASDMLAPAAASRIGIGTRQVPVPKLPKSSALNCAGVISPLADSEGADRSP